MPLKTPYTRDETERDLDNELFRWRNEFSMRNGEWSQEDIDDSVGVALNILNGDWEEKKDFIEEVKGEFRELKEVEPSMDRYHLLNTTLGNLHVASDIPDNFIDELVQVSTSYIDGFLPNQNITSPDRRQLTDIEGKGIKGDHEFLRDRIRVTPKPGRVQNGNSALAVAAHEVVHKNNVEAVVENPGEVRDLSWIYRKSLPESYRDEIEQSGVAECNHELLAGLTLQEIEPDTGIHRAHIDNDREKLDYEKHLDTFSQAVSKVEEKYSLTDFDIRDEAVAQAVSYFTEGHFEDGFRSKLRETRRAYNKNEDYTDDAGERIVEYLKAFRNEYENQEGLRGERFKQTMEKRISFLKNQYSFKE